MATGEDLLVEEAANENNFRIYTRKDYASFTLSSEFIEYLSSFNNESPLTQNEMEVLIMNL